MWPKPFCSSISIIRTKWPIYVKLKSVKKPSEDKKLPKSQIQQIVIGEYTALDECSTVIPCIVQFCKVLIWISAFFKNVSDQHSVQYGFLVCSVQICIDIVMCFEYFSALCKDLLYKTILYISQCQNRYLQKGVLLLQLQSRRMTTIRSFVFGYSINGRHQCFSES